MAPWFSKLFRAAGERKKALENQNSMRGYRFHYNVLQQATNNFDANRVIGEGGFGKVYLGVLSNETKVAVKRANLEFQQGQGLKEFRTEIKLLSGLCHDNLVSLIGYCNENNEMILVYEYMEKGTLRNHLYGSDNPALSWKQRLEVCIGAARGLHYLHTDSEKGIIHRDVKSSNILLDQKLVAKVADFGLSRIGPEMDRSHVSTAVKGSFGYLDPEYYRTQQLTKKSDVYSFGVVLLEVLCARKAVDNTLPKEKVNLAMWGMKMLKERREKQIIDQRIQDTIKPLSLKKFCDIVKNCLAEEGVDRPSMQDVLLNLEDILQLEDPNFYASDGSTSETIAGGGPSNEPDDLSNTPMSWVSTLSNGGTMHDIVELLSQFQNASVHESIVSDHELSHPIKSRKGKACMTRSLGKMYLREKTERNDDSV